METNILKQIGKEFTEYKTQSVQIVDKFKFNQKKTIERIFRYYNSVYETGEKDSEGFKKFFFNIVRNPCYVATKAIDFDTKDIIIQAAPGQSSLKAWLMDRDLKLWMKKGEFGKTLNRIFHELPIFGSVVLKKVQGQLFFLDLRNLINEQSADRLKDSNYVIEIHYYSPEELRKKNWDNVEEVIKMWRATNVPYIKILERYGEVPENWIREDGDPQKYVYSRFICYSKEGRLYDDFRRYELGVTGLILDKEEISREEFPYRDIHWEKIPGRWLGVGRVEMLFDPQIRINEMMNLRAKSSYFAAIEVFQTADETINKNLLTDVKSGQILHTRFPLTRVPTEERNLATYQVEHNTWLQNRDELTMAYDVIRGERLPAGTPLGAAVLAAQMTTSYFDQIRENIGLEIKELLYKDIIPQFQKENTGEHYLKLVGEDLDKWQNFQITLETNKELLKFLAQKRKLPTLVQYELMKARIVERRKAKKEEEILIPENFYQDLKYYIDIIITGEAKDIRTKAMNLQMVLQAITVDPTLLENPTKRKIFIQILGKAGMHIEDIEAIEKEPETLPEIVRRRAGGGIARPVAMPPIIPGREEVRV